MNNIEMINASAGSGKTYSLTARVVEILKSGLAPESLMATTFTNRAAAELRERIRFHLLKSHQSEEANRIYDGFIGTVNSICARLLKEYALEAGMSPAVDVMPEEDGTKIFKIAIDSVINQYADQMESAARRLELDGRGSGHRSTADWRDHVKEIVDLARDNKLGPDALRACCVGSWDTLQDILGEPLTTDIDYALQEALALAINHLDKIEPLTKTTQGALETLKDCAKRFKNNRLTWSDWTRLAKLNTAKDGQEIVAPVTAIADQVIQHPRFQNDVKQIIEGGFACAIQALDLYEAFKREHGLMDFVDQETRVLDLAQHNGAFRESLRDRIQLLMVDEFQDTSPIQLALFLSLHELAGHSVWVGDPKQAIYGFRGTDPQLMDEVVALMKESQVLNYSWRSRENLLAFTNALFSRVFHEMGEAKVCLKVPNERAMKARDGWLETWHLTAKNADDEAAALANGVRNLLERFEQIKPGDVAVLCRANDKCTKIAARLEELGVRVSVGQGALLDTRECQLALAALRYMNNSGDTVALAEIIHMSPGCAASAGWLTALMTEPGEAISLWRAEPQIAALDEGRTRVKHWTPLEALEQAIDRIDLLRTLKSWPNPGLAISNLDALRGTCREYIDQCASHRGAATIEGFVAYLQESNPEQAQGSGEQTVNILTYHGAKGLEWPWVVLTGLDASPRADVFGVHIEAAAQFDPVDPLANRKIHYWPWPFGAQKKYPALDEKIDDLPLKKIIEDKSEREEQRLLYVGMTRARDGLVMAIRKTANKSGEKLKTGWLDALKGADGKSVIEWSTDTDTRTIEVGSVSIPINVLEYGPQSLELPGLVTEEVQYLPALSGISTDFPPARVAPSSLVEFAGDSSTTLETISRFSRITIKGSPEMDELGSAVHAYLAVDNDGMTEELKMQLAHSIITRWGVNLAIDPAEVVAAGNRLKEFMDKQYPGYKAFKEWPISLRNDAGQLMQGWIDLLLESPDGYVIIDHKSYPGPDSEERVKKYVPQLRNYKEAVEKATGKPVIDMLLHLPISGLFIRVN